MSSPFASHSRNALPAALILALVPLALAACGDPGKKEDPEAALKRIQPIGQVAIAPGAGAPAAAAATAPGGKPDGKKVYDTVCMACHSTGAAGSPKFGDKAAWAPRIKTGMDALYTSALKGKNAMPPKGGAVSLSDADIKAGVDYIVGGSK